MNHRLVVFASLLLLLGLALAGCGNQITADEIVAKMQETMQNTDDAHAIVTASINAQGIDMSVTAEVWEKAPNLIRAQVLDATEPNLAGMLMVNDGQKAWVYEPSRNKVMVGPPSDMETPLPPEMLSSLQQTIQEILDVSDVELAGEESVAGREAYKLTISPREDSEQKVFPGNGTATVWVDKEEWFLLKADYVASAFGTGSMEVQSFELNPGLSDDLFHFDVPEGATVVDVESQKPVPMTLDEARAEANFPLLVPDYVPDGATLIDVFRVQDSYVLRYDHSPKVSFAIVQGPEMAGPPPMGLSEDATVRGHEATLFFDEPGGNTLLYWTEDGITITVAGHIPQSDALQVAESLK